MSSVKIINSRSSGLIVPSATMVFSIWWKGCQYSVPIRTMGKFSTFPVWTSVSASDSSSSVPRPPGRATNAYEVLEQQHFTDEKVPAGDRSIEIGVGRLLLGQLDIAADGASTGLSCSPVRRLHQAGSAAGHDRKSEAGHCGADLAAERVGTGVIPDSVPNQRPSHTVRRNAACESH